MNRLLRELGPTDLAAVSTIHQRLDDRLRRMRETAEELADRSRVIANWVDLQVPPPELAGSRVPWTAEREQLLNEKEVISRSLEEEKRASALLREAGGLLASFLELATAGLEEEAAPPGNDHSAPTGKAPSVESAETIKARTRAAEPVVALEIAPPTLEWRTLARECLEARGPLHYRDIYRHLRSRSIVFGGAHPPGTFLATLNRDSGFVRVGRGVYWLADQPLPASGVQVPDASSGTSGGHR